MFPDRREEVHLIDAVTVDLSTAGQQIVTRTQADPGAVVAGGSNTPATRGLGPVLRAALKDDDRTKLIVGAAAGKAAYVLAAPGKLLHLGPSVGYTDVTVEGETLSVPNLAAGGGGGGATGPPGAPGSKWYSGNGAPAGALGVVGDWYLNDANGDVYEKTGASAWTLPRQPDRPAGAGGPRAQGPAGSGGGAFLAQGGRPFGRGQRLLANFTGVHNVRKDAAGATLLRLEYTPAVDAWWEVYGHVGTLQKIDVAYHYAAFSLVIDPAPEGWTPGANRAVASDNLMQHADRPDLEPRRTSRTVALRAGQLYYAYLVISPNGGTWRYLRSPTDLWIEGKAWAR